MILNWHIKYYWTTLQCSSVFSAASFPFPIQRAIYLDENDHVQMFDPTQYNKRSQDLKESFHDAGQFYLCRSSVIHQELNLTNSPSKIVHLPRYRVIDIDTNEDFEVAEKMMKTLKR